MISVFEWFLGLIFATAAAVAVLRRRWLVAAFYFALATAVAFVILFMSDGQEAFDILLKSFLILFNLLLPGIFLWTNAGQRFSEANYLSAGGGKAFGAFLLSLAMVGIVAMVGSALQ